MKKHTKTVSIILALLLAVSLLVSCNKAEQKNGSSVATEEKTSEVSKDNATEIASQSETAVVSESEGEGIEHDNSVELPSGFEVDDVKANENYKIAFANWNSTNSAAALFASEMEKAAQYYGVELLLMDNKQDPVQAVDNVNNAITWNADYYIQYNEDPDANLRIGEMLNEEGIYGLAVQVPLGDDFPYYRLDPAESGYSSGKPLAEKAKEVWGDDVSFAIIMDCPEAGAVIQDRAAAAEKAILEVYPDINIVTYSSEGDPEVSRNKMADVLTANPEGNFIFWGHMDQWTLAALQSIKAANRYEECIATSVAGLAPMFEECIATSVEIGRAHV